MLAPSIAVHSCLEVDAAFNARFSARSRTYIYGILEGPPDPFLSRTTMHHPVRLDVGAMNEAAGHLLGSHDFSSFGRLPDPGPGGEPPSATRNLFELRCSRDGTAVKVKARANAFIQQMVRSLVGTLVKVGEGELDPAQMPAVVTAKNRAAAGPVAPAQGLCLVAVEYDDGWSRPPRASV
jgi:tRNA pseudouridine38-40 synthase